MHAAWPAAGVLPEPRHGAGVLQYAPGGRQGTERAGLLHPQQHDNPRRVHQRTGNEATAGTDSGGQRRNRWLHVSPVAATGQHIPPTVLLDQQLPHPRHAHHPHEQGQ